MIYYRYPKDNHRIYNWPIIMRSYIQHIISNGYTPNNIKNTVIPKFASIIYN